MAPRGQQLLAAGVALAAFLQLASARPGTAAGICDACSAAVPCARVGAAGGAAPSAWARAFGPTAAAVCHKGACVPADAADKDAHCAGKILSLDLSKAGTSEEGASAVAEGERRIERRAEGEQAQLDPQPNTCQYLQYSRGYVNVTANYYASYPNTHHKGECCALCNQDPRCRAWTRVAGHAADFRTCYLADTVSDMDSAPGAAATSSAAPSLAKAFPAIRYVNEAHPTIFESGTKPKLLPLVMYGCPYPATKAGQCNPPPSCNCYKGVCTGSCKSVCMAGTCNPWQ